MAHKITDIPVIDLFAGPGGLGEEFSEFRDPRGRRPFQIAVSNEMDEHAHRTLRLRS
ncbi:MAG: DNA cytosine methyltransferase [Phycisphaeraceae bacterium]|nr:DNA cytosine methyltransferase [Phycisphaeraceae bacterium]